MKNSDVGTVVTLTTPAISRSTNSNNICDRSLLVQSMYACNSGSYVTEQEQTHINRPKPPPPVKPSIFKNKTAYKSIESSFSQTSKLSVSIINENLSKASSNTVDSSEVAIHEERNKGIVCTLDDTMAGFDSSFEAMRITNLCIEELKRVESESSASESSKRSNSRSAIINKRTSFINEEIKKPKMKPPPPPIQSLQHPSKSTKNINKIETNRKKLNLESVFGTNQNATENDVDSDESGPSKAHRFERYLDSLHIPR